MNLLSKLYGFLALVGGLIIISSAVYAEDIDIFVGSTRADTGLPNVIFVLDNTSNWARQSQGWPGGLQQGQSEARAIKAALAGLTDKANVGLVEFTTAGNANQDGGYVRFDLQKLTSASQQVLGTKLDQILNDVNGTMEKRNSNTSYGNLMYDVYSYLAGYTQSYSGGGTEPARADSAAYATQWSKFRSPLDSDSVCARIYVIFIGNPNSSGPASDSATNSAVLASLYDAVQQKPDGLAGSTGVAPLPIPKFTVTTVTEPSTNLGFSKACYKDADVASCTTAEAAGSGLCVGKADCACNTSSKASVGGTPACVTGDPGKNQKNRLAVLLGGTTSTVITESGTFDTSSGLAWNFDDWAKFLHDYGVPVKLVNEQGLSYVERVPVITYTIDVFNKQQNADQTGLMLNASQGVGGGRYFAAKNEDSIVKAITSTLSDILSVSSTFAAVTLPLSATNRAQSENQVFIGMFRPDQAAKPRWFGNLKRYQIGLFNNIPELADANGKEAVNPVSGFAGECAESYWTTNSGDYWAGLGLNPSPRSQCVDSPNSVWSDLPDGPFVEKGGAAQVSRKSDLSKREVLTVSANALQTMTNAAAVGGQSVLDYLVGTKMGVDETAPDTGGRPSIQGDVVHSRPLTINYGGTTGTFVFYGSNDGLYRSIKADTGSEQWSLLAPEHYSKINRLYQNSPIVAFPNQDMTVTPTPTDKDYFFDGSTGQVVRYNSQNQVDLAYIFPTMRRGGRMVYALDVTTPGSPSLLWRQGCSDASLSVDTNCTVGFTGMGQTWSIPVGALLDGYKDGQGAELPVVMFGGGYDTCLDKDAASYACSSPKGRGIYVLDAKSGTLLRGPTELPTDAPVVADMGVVDINRDGKIDFAYAADAAGGLYRVNFSQLNTDGSITALPKTSWSITKIAVTNNPQHRFLNAPIMLSLKDRVYVALGSGNRERPLESNYPYKENVDDRFYVFSDFPAVSVSSPVDLDGKLMLDVTEAAPGADVDCNAKGERGWYMSLLGRGEQVVNPAAIGGGRVFFNSYRPGGTSVGLCTRPLGIGTGYQMSLLNASACDVNRDTEIVGGGMPIAPIITTVRVGTGTGGGTGTDTGDGKLVTVCIGCQGLLPVDIIAAPPETRKRTYWNSDIDR